MVFWGNGSYVTIEVDHANIKQIIVAHQNLLIFFKNVTIGFSSDFYDASLCSSSGRGNKEDISSSKINFENLEKLLLNVQMCYSIMMQNLKTLF